MDRKICATPNEIFRAEVESQTPFGVGASARQVVIQVLQYQLRLTPERARSIAADLIRCATVVERHQAGDAMDEAEMRKLFEG